MFPDGCFTKTTYVDDSSVKFEILDTAGKFRYDSGAAFYYELSQASIVVYDITQADTFARAKALIRKLKSNASPNIVIALVGNKKDLTSRRKVQYEVRWHYCLKMFILVLL